MQHLAAGRSKGPRAALNAARTLVGRSVNYITNNDCSIRPVFLQVKVPWMTRRVLVEATTCENRLLRLDHFRVPAEVDVAFIGREHRAGELIESRGIEKIADPATQSIPRAGWFASDGG
jgi:hypothetical protein